MEEQIDVVFLETTTGQKSTEVTSMVTMLHVVDIQSLTHTSVIGKKGMDKHAVASLQSFREELDRQKVVLRSECGSTVTALTRGERMDHNCGEDIRSAIASVRSAGARNVSAMLCAPASKSDSESFSFQTAAECFACASYCMDDATLSDQTRQSHSI